MFYLNEDWQSSDGDLYIRDNADRARIGRGPRNELLQGVIGRRESIIGLLTGSMSQDIAYQFIKIGCNIERADMTTRIIDVNSAVRLPADPTLAAVTIERMWLSTLNALSVLHEYLDQIQSDLGAVHGAVARQYFHLHHQAEQ